MVLFKRLGALIALVTLAVAKDDTVPVGDALDPYSIAPVPGDLVVNGGFENGNTGWTLSADSFLSILLSAAGAFSGNAYTEFGTVGHEGSRSQTITTVAGTTYIVNFHLACGSSGTTNSFRFLVDGSQKYSITNDVAHDFVLHTYAFTASGGTAALEFFSRHDPSFFYLDDVSVVVLPVPCNSNLYEFDPLTGNIIAASGKIYPGPPQPDSTFPVITDAGQLLFNFKSDTISPTLPRVITLGLAKDSSTQDFDHTLAVCQFQKVQATGCPSFSDIGFVFSKDVPFTIQDDFESLFVKGCVTRTIASDFSTVTYSGEVLTLYMDAYDLGNRWSELKPISFSTKLPYTAQASTSAVVDVVSDVVAVEYQPLEIINQGTSANPIVQFTTIARSFYPFVAYGSGATYTPPASSSNAVSDPSASAVGTCVLLQPSGQVASSTTFCDANAGLCTVECTRIISLTAPACDLSGYDWAFTFNEYQDFSLTTPAHTLVSDPSQTPFTEQLLFDNSPVWNVCPTADSSDYSRFTSSAAVHGHFDTTTGVAVADPTTPAAINTPLNFGFKIFIQTDGAGNPTSNSATKIYRARLTEMQVTRPDSTNFYLVGSSSNPTIGGPGPDQNRVHDLTFNPVPAAGVYNMFISPQGPSDPKFAAVAVTFTPNVGASSGPNLLYYSDSSAPSGVTLTVTFAGVISLFADGSTPSKRDIVFRRQITLSPNGTYADPSQIVNSLGTQNSTTIVIQVSQLAKAINTATIVGSVVGGVVGLGLFVIAFLFYKRSKKANQFVISSEKLESGSI